MEISISKLKGKDIIDEDMFLFLNQYRRYRNRVAHIYKQPSTEEIIEFTLNNKHKINEMVNIMSNMYKKI